MTKGGSNAASADYQHNCCLRRLVDVPYCPAGVGTPLTRKYRAVYRIWKMPRHLLLLLVIMLTWLPAEAAASIPTSPSARSSLAVNASRAPRFQGGVDPSAAISATFAVGNKIKGGNIVPRPSVGPSGLWAEWDWENWIKPQVDRAISLGFNTIRAIGAPQVVLVRTSGEMPRLSSATYNARWEQLAAYCLEKGIRLYPSLTEKWAFMYSKFGDMGGEPPWNFQDPTVTEIVVSSAAALAKFPNVIGFDIFQEGGGSHGDGLVVEDVLALYRAIREVAPQVPLTTSESSASYPTPEAFWSNTTSLPYQLWVHPDGADFIDVHIYLESVDPDDIDELLARTGLPAVIGEFGGGQDIPREARIARYRSAQVLHNRADVSGSLVWALADQGISGDKMFGVFDNTGYVASPPGTRAVGGSPLSVTVGQRTELVDALRTFD